MQWEVKERVCKRGNWARIAHSSGASLGGRPARARPLFNNAPRPDATDALLKQILTHASASPILRRCQSKNKVANSRKVNGYAGV